MKGILIAALLLSASLADAQHLLMNGFPYDEAAVSQARSASAMHVVHMDWPMDWRNPQWPAFLEQAPDDDRPVYLALAPFADRDTFMGSFADYRNYCRKAIAHYRPLYCNLGIEAQDPRFAAWFDALVNGQRVLWWRTTGLRREFPGVKFGASFQADFWNPDSPIWKTADWAGVTYYPQLYAQPVDIGWILDSVDIPLALCEVGMMTYGAPELEAFQPLFVDWIVSMPVEFVMWLAPHDFNGEPDYWNTVGLWRADGSAKPAVEAWL